MQSPVASLDQHVRLRSGVTVSLLPPELRPYGLTSTDFWAAMLVTGLYVAFARALPSLPLFAFVWLF